MDDTTSKAAGDTPAKATDQAQRLARALAALQAMRAKLDQLTQRASEPIAVVGMACRFPGGADSPEAFWRLLRAGTDMVTEVPASRWDVDAYHDPDPAAPGRITSRFGSFLEGVHGLDGRFFNLSPREAAALDPQHKLLLEVSWEALESAGLTPELLAAGPTGLFVGMNTSDYLLNQLLAGEPEDMDFYLATGNTHSVATGRVSHALGLRGPSMAIDTACSSSLTAVHLACQSLRSGECRAALAGGVNLTLAPEVSVTISHGRVFAADGRCKTFDAAADGYVRGEGCGVLALKRLSDALADGDTILAQIRGSAVNHGGVTVPHGPSQEAVIRAALSSCSMDPSRVSYVEAHGTGTSLGDPIEVRALSAALGPGRKAGSPLWLGSVKTNMGHLEAAAGVAGLMKVVLSLVHREIPPHLHFRRWNPLCEVESPAMSIPTEVTPWQPTSGPRVAGISSFGIGGTNAHVIVEEAPAAAPRAEAPPGPALLPLSARSAEGLRRLAAAYGEWIAGPASPPLRDVCFTASVRRAHHEHRVAVTGGSSAEIAEGLRAFAAGAARVNVAAGRASTVRRAEVVLVFSGQGSQWAGMGRDLIARSAVLRESLARCDAAIRAQGGPSVLAEIQGDTPSRLDAIDVLQPVLFALQVALCDEWRSLGVIPDAVIGHSLGEVAAAHVAGALSLEDAARVVCARSRLLARLGGQGTMAIVELPPDEVSRLIEPHRDRLSIAACNGPTSTVISGAPPAVDAVLAALAGKDVFCRRIDSTVAGHCPQVDAILPDLRESLRAVAPRAAAVPFYSAVTGEVLSGDRLDAGYWCRNVRETVQFAAALRSAVLAEHTTFLEVAMHPVLAPSLQAGLRALERTGAVLASARRGEPARAVMLASLGALYTAGYPLDLRLLHPDGGAVVALPPMAWVREEHARVIRRGGPPSKDGPRPAGRGARQEAAQISPHPDGVVPARGDGVSPGGGAARRGLLEEFWAAPEAGREAVACAHLRAQAARVLSLSEDHLDVNDPVGRLGMSSLMVFDLKSWVKGATSVSVPVETFTPVASVADLAKDLTARLIAAGPPGSAPPAAPAPAAPVVEAPAPPSPRPGAAVAGRSGPVREEAPGQESPWIVRARPNDAARLRLFCFPFAGAGASAFLTWPDGLPADLDVCAIQPPGRDRRLKEPPIRQLSLLVREVAGAVTRLVDRPYAFFGHSFGGLVSYEVARELRRRGARAPEHLIVSASRAPAVPDLRPPSHRFPDDRFIEEVRRLGGMPEEILNDRELLQVFLPALRADFAMLETYVHLRQDPLDCPITAFEGERDATVHGEQVDRWQAETRGRFEKQVFPGGHFFITGERIAVLRRIAAALGGAQEEARPRDPAAPRA